MLFPVRLGAVFIPGVVGLASIPLGVGHGVAVLPHERVLDSAVRETDPGLTRGVELLHELVLWVTLDVS